MRGLKDVAFIYLDEADFFPPGQQQDARDVSERYIAKSNPWIVMVSTPNAPEGLFERIEQEPANICLYKRLLLDYTYGLGKIYTQDEIDAAKQSYSATCNTIHMNQYRFKKDSKKDNKGCWMRPTS